MQKLKVLVAAVLAGPLSACSQPVERFVIDGVEGEFCPPSEMVPPDIAWLPEDPIDTPQGFSTKGCATRPSDNTTECSKLGQIISMDFSPQGSGNFFRWEDFKLSALAIRFMEDEKTHYEIHGSQLVIRNEHIWRQWLILNPHAMPTEQALARPQDEDVVMAACSAIEDFPLASRENTGRNYGCYRHVEGPGYSLDYRFVSDNEIPDVEELSKMDSNIISQIDSWKCRDN